MQVGDTVQVVGRARLHRIWYDKRGRVVRAYEGDPITQGRPAWIVLLDGQEWWFFESDLRVVP